LPWKTVAQNPLTSDSWDLYDVRSDFSLTKNLAAVQPAKLKELQALFMKEAEKYNVLPIDDRLIERANPALAGRPDVMGGRTSLTLYEGMEGMLENTFMNVKNQSKKITAALGIPAGGANGAILSQGGRFGGWSLYMKDGKPAYDYNFLGLERYTIAAPKALPAGPATVTLDFAYDGRGYGKGGKATLLVNGKPVAEGRVEKTQPNVFSADETADVGLDNQTPVAEGIGSGAETRFTGKINKITLEVQPVK
jgi:arylsulfatase